MSLQDYYTIIKHPIDLGVIGRKISASEYKSAWIYMVWRIARFTSYFARTTCGCFWTTASLLIGPAPSIIATYSEYVNPF